MSLNGIRAEGDDQKWKTEAEREFEKLKKEIEALRNLVQHQNLKN